MAKTYYQQITIAHPPLSIPLERSTNKGLCPLCLIVLIINDSNLPCHQESIIFILLPLVSTLLFTCEAISYTMSLKGWLGLLKMKWAKWYLFFYPFVSIYLSCLLAQIKLDTWCSLSLLWLMNHNNSSKFRTYPPFSSKFYFLFFLISKQSIS